jgi:hypothetical protein
MYWLGEPVGKTTSQVAAAAVQVGIRKATSKETALR